MVRNNTVNIVYLLSGQIKCSIEIVTAFIISFIVKHQNPSYFVSNCRDFITFKDGALSERNL